MDEGDTERTVREYYDAIDAKEYDRLAELLRPSFTQYRPDRTLEGRDRFVRFMRDDRPMTDTAHAIDAVYPDGPGIAVRGRLLGSDGDELFAFVDVFSIEDGDLAQLRTFTR